MNMIVFLHFLTRSLIPGMVYVIPLNGRVV